MAKRMQDKAVIVTVASSGLGRATAELMIAKGARVVTADINRGRAGCSKQDRTWVQAHTAPRIGTGVCVLRVRPTLPTAAFSRWPKAFWMCGTVIRVDHAQRRWTSCDSAATAMP